MQSWMRVALAAVLPLACATAEAPKSVPTPIAAAAKPLEPNHLPDGETAGAKKVFDHVPKIGEKAICAVSGEAFVIAADTITAEHGGKYYAFCCDDCAPEFKANPAKFVTK